MEVHRVIPEAHSSNILCVAYNPYQQRLFTGSEDHTIKVWETESGKLERTLVKHGGWVTDLLYCDRYNILFSCSMDGLVVAWSPLLKWFSDKRLNIPCSCLAWDKKKKHLVVGLKEFLHIYKVTKYRFDNSSDLLEPVSVVRLSGDFVKCMVCFDSKIITGGFDRAICVFESATGRKIMRIPKSHKAAVSVIAYDEDNNRFITGGFDKKIKIWNLDGTIVFEIGGFSDVITGVCYNQITKSLWVSANSQQPQIFDPVSGMNVLICWVLDAHFPEQMTEYMSGISSWEGKNIQQLKFVPFTGEILGIIGNKGIITWKHNPFTALTTIHGSGDVIEALTYTAKRYGPQIFSVGGDMLIKRWEINEADHQVYGQEKYRGHTGSILCVKYCDELDMLITGSADKFIRLWCYAPLPKNDSAARTYKRDLARLKKLEGQKSTNQLETMGRNWLEKVTGLDYQYVLEGHSDAVTSLAYVHRDENHYLISVSWDLSIMIWDINKETNNLKKIIFEAHSDYITDVDYSRELNEFATVSVDGSINIWKFGTWELVHSIVHGHSGEISQVRWHDLLTCWVTASHDSSVRMWSPDGTTLQVIRTSGGVTALCIDKNFGYVVVGTTDHLIRVYDPSHDMITQENAGHTDVITSIVHVQETGQYVSASWDQTLRIWSAPSIRFNPKANPEELYQDARKVMTYSERSMPGPRAVDGNSLAKGGNLDSLGQGQDPLLKKSRLKGPTLMKKMLEKNTQHFQKSSVNLPLPTIDAAGNNRKEGNVFPPIGAKVR